MSERWPIIIYWRPLGFFAALFWLWYLAPAVLESRALARVIVLLHP